MSSRRVKLIINSQGLVRAICSDQALSFARAIAGGAIDVRRASHVEWSTGLSPAALQWLAAREITLVPGWWADLTPSGGPVLGAFEKRDAALEAELQWLYDNNIPTGNA